MMDEKELEYYDNFEYGLVEDMFKICDIKGMLLASEDINGKWEEFAPEYLNDAIREIRDYPEAALAWAGYIGMAIAKWWDEDWVRHSTEKYSALYGKEGFDDMDEHIMQDIVGVPVDSDEYNSVRDLLMSCTQSVISKILHEKVEPQSVRAFYLTARAARALFRIGAAIELRRLGYIYDKVQVGTPDPTVPAPKGPFYS